MKWNEMENGNDPYEELEIYLKQINVSTTYKNITMLFNKKKKAAQLTNECHSLVAGKKVKYVWMNRKKLN